MVVDSLLLEMLAVECLIVAFQQVNGGLRVLKKGEGMERRVRQHGDGDEERVWMLVV